MLYVCMSFGVFILVIVRVLLLLWIVDVGYMLVVRLFVLLGMMSYFGVSELVGRSIEY